MRQNRFPAKLSGFAMAMFIATILAARPVLAGTIGFNPGSQYYFMINEGDPALDITFTFVNGSDSSVTNRQAENRQLQRSDNGCQESVHLHHHRHHGQRIRAASNRRVGGRFSGATRNWKPQQPYTADAVVWVNDSPEPATIALVGLGCVVFGVCARRRRRR
jgi:hypothetical protein